MGNTSSSNYSNNAYEGIPNTIGVRTMPRIGTETINKAILGFITSYIDDHDIKRDKIINYLPEIKDEVIKNLTKKYGYGTEQATKLVNKNFRQMIELHLNFVS